VSKYPIPFGRHLLLERINVGGMAEVFKAKAFGVEGFERIVAVKRILPTLLEDDEFITMFIDEARIAAHLTHQNIVQIYELGKHEETFFISMEYVAGKDLRQILDYQKKLKVPMSIPKACFIVSRVCEALEYAHKKKDPAGRDLKIIHRDVTPQNVIISFEGEVKLCDFGIAKAASRVSRTQVGVLKGKFAYMSPEQVRGQPTDRRSDLFALGVIFYEMLTQQRLFLADSDYTTLENVRNAIIPPPREVNPQIPEGLEALMLKLLAADPKQRYQWASEVHEDLLDFLVQNNRLYHGRHLRTGMQETYGRDIEIENEKLEAFMRLKMDPPTEPEPPAPPPSAVVAALAREGENAAWDPASVAHDDDDLGGPTDSIAIPSAPFSGDDETESSISDAAQPTLAGASPVAHLFGAPELDETPEEDAALTDGDMVVVAAGSEPKPQIEASMDTTESPLVDFESAERTQFDAVPGIPDNDTLYDDANDTVMGDTGADEISAAQAELISRLGAVGALEGETIDSADISEEVEVVHPQVYDPANSEEEAPTMHGPAAHDPDERYDTDDLDGPDDSATNVAPLVVGMAPEDAVALLPDSRSGEYFESDDGTLEDAEAFVPTYAGSNDETSDLEMDDPTTAAGDPHEIRVGPAPRMPSSPPGMLGPDTPFPPNPPNGAGPFPSSDGARPFAPDVGPRFASPDVASPSRATPSAAVVARAAPSLERSRMLMFLAGGVGVLAAVLLAVLVLTFGPSGASLQIVTEPTRHVTVVLDGKVIAEETPIDIDELTIGTHHVELRADGFRTYRQTIEIGEAKPHTMVVPLDRDRSSKAAPPPSEALPEGDSDAVARGPELEADPAPDPEVGAGADSDPDTGSDPDSDPGSDSDSDTGSDPDSDTGSDPDSDTGSDSDSDTGSDSDSDTDTDTGSDTGASAPPATARIEPPPPPPVRAPPPPPPPRPKVRRPPSTGSLMISTRPPGVKVLIDGKDTGQRTPIRKPYALPVGTHVITFVMSDSRRYDFDVRIEKGRVTKFAKLLR
jgi:serine/threonine protein kinase